jgi:signal transduction histidine kinase
LSETSENLRAIPGEKQERIFERFYRGTDARKLISGAGLSL